MKPEGRKCDEMRVVLASHNPDKLKEFEQILQLNDLELVSQSSLGLLDPVEETGKTYRENALIKARAAYDRFNLPVLADDSGLSVDLLDGYPGIYSARFAGEETSYPDKMLYLWDLLRSYPQSDWTAAFICAICFIDPQGTAHFYEGKQQGMILPEVRGHNGFGYDPIFQGLGSNLTNAELDPGEKHARSHRGKALKAFREDWLAGKFAL